MSVQKLVELSNGAQLVYQKQKSFDGASFVIGFLGGAQLDGKYQGISHLLEHLLFRPANSDMRQNVLNSIMANTIGQNAFTTNEYLAVVGSATNNNLEKAIDNCVTILTPKEFTKEQIKKEVEIVKHEIALDCKEPESIVDMFLGKLAGYDLDEFSDDTVLGTARSLSKVTPELLKEYVDRYFNSNNLIISVTSNRSLEEIKTLCEEHIVSKFPKARDVGYIVESPVYEYYEPKNLLMAVPAKNASNININLLVRTRDGECEDVDREFAFDMVEQYLCNSVGGLMWNALREKNSLVYKYSQSVIEEGSVKFKYFDATTNAKHMNKTIKEICTIIKTLSEEGVSEETFEIIKKSLSDKNNASLNKYKSATAMTNFQDLIYERPFVDYKNVTKIIDNMTHEEFNDYLQDQYKVKNISLLITGDFDSRKVPTLVEVEEMAGNYDHSAFKDLFNPPRFEQSSCVSKGVVIAREQAEAEAAKDAAEEAAVMEVLENLPPIIAIDNTPVE